MAIKIYTDGSSKKMLLSAGAGAVMIFPNGHLEVITKYLGNKTNNFAELYAIYTALCHALSDFGSTVPIEIYSDSKYALQAITGNVKAKKNLDLIAKSKGIAAEFDNISFNWVKGHSGNKYNHLAHLLASIAIEQGLQQSNPSLQPEAG
tara:strand:- start:936 stop:1382 length:447 start_codon:yes stop_codon:yes gene_type:complete